MSDQGERWNAPGGDVNDYAPADRSIGPKPQPDDADPFAARFAQGRPVTPQQTGSGVTTAAQQEPVVGRMTFSSELMESPEGPADFSGEEFPTPGFPPPLEPAATESAISAFPAPELPSLDYPARRYPERHAEEYITQEYPEQDFPAQDRRAQDFSGQDFPGQDFTAQDFSGQDFSGQGFSAVDDSLDGVPGAAGAERPGETFGSRYDGYTEVAEQSPASPAVPPAGSPETSPSWDSHAFDGVDSGAGESNYAGVDMSGPGTPPKPGMPSSGNWRMPEWMAEEDKDGGASKDDFGGDDDGSRSRVGLFAGVSLLVIALVASAVVLLLKSGGTGNAVPPAQPTKGAASKNKATKAAAAALPPDKRLTTFPGTHTKLAGRINDTFSGLSYPRFGAPWTVPTSKSGLALLGWSGQQIVVTEHNPKQLWYAQLLSGVLGPAEQDIWGGPGTEHATAVAYAKATEAQLYGFAHKSRPLASQPLQLNGHKGWLISSYLTFHRAGIKATGDILTVAVINTGRKTPAVLLMAVPNTNKKLWPDINYLVASLKVLP